MSTGVPRTDGDVLRPGVASRPGPPTLRHALVSHFTAFALIPALAGGLLIVVGGSWLIQRQVFAHMQSVADGAAAELQLVASDTLQDLDRFLHRQQLRRCVWALAQAPSPEAATPETRHWVDVDLAQLLASSEHLGGAVVVSSLATGRPLAWRGCSAAHAAEIVRNHVPARGLAAATYSPAHVYSETGKPVIAAIQAMPLPQGQSGAPVAAIVWHVPLAYRFYPAIEERAHIGRTGEVVLADKSGLALHELRYEPGSAFHRRIAAVPVRAAIAGQHGIKLARDYRGVLVVAAVNRVPLTGWGIVAKQDAAEAYAGVGRLALIWLAFVVVLAGGVLVAARRVGARFIEPVEELASATHRVAHGDLVTPIPAQRADELGALIGDFNAMATAIAASQAAVVASERQYRTLFEGMLEGYAHCRVITDDTGATVDWEYLSINPAFEAITRLTGAVGKRVTELIPGVRTDNPRLFEIYGDVARTGNPESVEEYVPGLGLWLAITLFSPQPGEFVAVFADVTERKQAEAAREAALAEVEASRARLAAALASMTDAVFISDSGASVVEFNDAFVAYCRFASRAECRKTVAEFSDYLELRFADGTLAPLDMWATPRALRGETATNAEYLLRRKDTGETWWGSYSFGPIRGGDGEIVGAVVVARDVTTAKQAEADLRASEERYRSLYRAIAGGVFVEAPDGEILDANDAAAEILGRDREEMEGRAADEIAWEVIREDGSAFPRDEHPTVVAVRTGQPVRDVVMGVPNPRTRSIRWLHVSAEPLLDAVTGETTAAVATFSDITDRKQAEQALRASEAKYRALFDSMLNGFALHEMIYDEAGRPVDYRFLEINAAFEGMTGLSRTEATGKTVLELIPDLEPYWIERYASVVAGAGSVRFEQHAAALGRWFSVLAYSPQPGQFATIFEDVTVRKQAEQALRESEAKYRTLFDSMLNGFTLCELVYGEDGQPSDYRHLEANEAFERHTGLRREDVVGRLGSELTPHLEPEWMEAFVRVAQTGAPRRLERYLGDLDRWLSVQLYSPRRGQFASVFEDITDRRKAVEALELSERRFRETVDLLPVAVWESDAQANITFVNRQLTLEMGYTEADLAAGISGFEVIAPADREAAHLHVAGIFGGQPTESVEYQLTRKDGTPFPAALYMALIGDPAQPQGLRGVIVDLTERHRAEAALAESEALFRTTFEEASVGTALSDADGTLIRVNQSLCDIVGRTAEEIQGTSLMDITHPDDVQASEEFIARLSAPPTATGRIEKRYLRPDGQVVWVDVTTSLLRRPDGTPLLFVSHVVDVTERRQAEAALAESEALFRTVFEAANVGQSMTALDGTLLRVNQAFCDLLLYTPEEMARVGLAGITHPDDMAATRGLVALLPNDPVGTGRLQKRYVRSDGEVVWADMSTSLIRHGDGTPRFFITQVLDMTEQHRSREALDALTARLQAIITAAPVGITHMDLAKGVQVWNPAMERLFGWSEQEVLGTRMPPAIPAAEQEQYNDLVEEVVGRGEIVTGREALRAHRDGTPVPVSLSLAPLSGGDGSVSGFVAIIADIRERLRADREFEERTALDKLVQVTHLLLQETAPEGLLQRLAEGARELFAAEICRAAVRHEDGAFRLCAASAAEGYPDTLTDDAAEAQRSTYLGLLDGVGSFRLDAEQLAARALTPPAHLGLQGFLGATLTDGANEPLGAILIARAAGGVFTPRDEALLHQLATLASLALARLDALHELDLQARALEASNRELESFSYSVSHDLRAPLRAIDGFSQALLEDYAPHLDAAGQRHLQRVRGASQRLGELIDDLLQLSRVTRDPMRYQTVDLSALAHQIIEELRAGEPDRQVEVMIEEGLTAQGHPMLLRALLANLLGNAWKFTRPHDPACLVFGHEPEAPELTYFVRDNGAGFDMRYADKLFAPFQRLHTQDEFPGNGVGLATVQRVVNRHGGRVWAEGSTGEGAVFRFTLGR